MQFAVVTAYLPLGELPVLAAEIDRLGYASMSVADHVVDLETLATPYPYEASGERRWPLDVDWPDTWVTIGALAAVTTRLRFFTSIYVAALRNPFSVAKAVGTAAALSGGRVALGVGVGWCREEFELMGEDFVSRGRRTDEGLALMKALWEPGMTEFEGEFYSAPRLMMRPEPPAPVPIWVGGLSDVAYRRAARHDGWVGDMCTVEQAAEVAGILRAHRRDLGREDEPFEVVPALMDAFVPDDFARAHDAGITQTMTVPWMYYYGQHCTLEQKLDGLRRFRDDVLEPVERLVGGTA
ncbi:TIGR03619 family F420-dependent LLM class oxidoreductase [Nocardioides sp. R-C-SC26]|uniref:TIGR03619 family F420-dependent LLM class oxidoreductase n=1 Tax=Nocardioides sp. R-C-SC26 TaxID=2870414 RepID=UPI001E4BC71E|nr:TIGR03619 family F420-dependent LLM class oxidoreductase [Nocardioides sp. R-C-SC26]